MEHYIIDLKKSINKRWYFHDFRSDPESDLKADPLFTNGSADPPKNEKGYYKINKNKLQEKNKNDLEERIHISVPLRAWSLDLMTVNCSREKDPSFNACTNQSVQKNKKGPNRSTK